MPSYSNLRNLQRYLSRYNYEDQPAAFEYLIASTFSQIFYLPFQSRDNEDSTVNHRVIWHGRIDKRSKTISKSPSGPDAICFAYGSYVLIESTLKFGANQWRNEFVQCLTHYDNFIENKKVDKQDVYLVLVARKIHKDTYTGFRQKANEGCNIIVLEGYPLAKIGDTSRMVPTVKHLDLLQLFKELVDKLRESTSFNKLRSDLNKSISTWQEDVLKREKTAFFGLKSYEAMKKIGRSIVGTSEILLNLHKDSKFNRYTQILGIKDPTELIRDGLISERLACLIRTPREDFFCRVDSTDFKAVGIRLIKAVEDIN